MGNKWQLTWGWGVGGRNKGGRKQRKRGREKGGECLFLYQRRTVNSADGKPYHARRWVMLSLKWKGDTKADRGNLTYGVKSLGLGGGSNDLAGVCEEEKKEKKKLGKKSDVRGEEVGWWWWKEHGRMMEVRLPSAGRWNVARGGEISFTGNYKQGEGADGSCRNQDERSEREYREKERKMKLLLNGTNHRGEVIRAVSNHYNDNMVWHDSYSTQRKSFAQAGEEIGRRAAS